MHAKEIPVRKDRDQYDTSLYFAHRVMCRANIRVADSVPGQPSKVQRIIQRMQKVGTIEIKVFSENYGKQGGDMNATSEGFLESDDETIPEKALKGQAKSHGTAYVQ